MKKVLLACLLFSFYSYSTQAQKIRLNGYALYAFDDAVDSYYSTTSYFNTVVRGGLVWGAGLEFMVRPDQYGVELLYMRQDTEAPTSYYEAGNQNSDFDVAINWIMLSFNRYQRLNPKVEGYGGLGLGVGIFDVTNPKNGNSDNSTKFAWAFKLGVNIYASERFGIKLQTGLTSAVQAVGGTLYFGTGGGGVGAGTYSSMLQFQIGGGIVIPFKSGETTTTAPPRQY